MTDNDKLDAVLAEYFTWRGEAITDISQTQNYKRLKQAILDWHSHSLAQAVAEARIKALTDVDNLNLLNDSDEWHEFYLANLKPQETE